LYTQEDPDNSELLDEGDIQMKYYSDLSYNPSTGALTKKMPARTQVIIQHLSGLVAGLTELCYNVKYTERHYNMIILAKHYCH
jgi:hypothetical protein